MWQIQRLNVQRVARPLVVFYQHRQCNIAIDYSVPISRCMMSIWLALGITPKSEDEYTLHRLSPGIFQYYSSLFAGIEKDLLFRTVSNRENHGTIPLKKLWHFYHCKWYVMRLCRNLALMPTCNFCDYIDAWESITTHKRIFLFSQKFFILHMWTAK